MASFTSSRWLTESESKREWKGDWVSQWGPDSLLQRNVASITPLSYRDVATRNLEIAFSCLPAVFSSVKRYIEGTDCISNWFLHWTRWYYTVTLGLASGDPPINWSHHCRKGTLRPAFGNTSRRLGTGPLTYRITVAEECYNWRLGTGQLTDGITIASRGNMPGRLGMPITWSHHYNKGTLQTASGNTPTIVNHITIVWKTLQLASKKHVD